MPHKLKSDKLEYDKQYRETHKEERAQYLKANREKIRKQASEYYHNHYKDKKREYNKQYRQLHKEKRRQFDKKYFQIPKNRISHMVSKSINKCLINGKQGYHWESLVNYSLSDLMNYLESSFKGGMTWNNYGKYGWHIDHIIPIALWKFDKPTDSEFKQCWALCNLQPLWAEDNCSKGSKYLN